MVALKMEDLKQFTSLLFVGETFDAWLVREAVIVTFNAFTIDGHVRQGYYSEQELEEQHIEALSAWKVLRPFCFSLIKGRKLPESFQITLQLPPDGVEAFLNEAGLSFSAEQIQALYLNVRYEAGALHCVTGTSLSVFTLDRQVETAWDEAVRRYLKKVKLPYSEE